MALFLFTKAILAGEPIKAFNHGKHKRSSTCIDNIVEAVIRTLDTMPAPKYEWGGDALDSAFSSAAPYRHYNIGNQSSMELLKYIQVLEDSLGCNAVMEMLPLQAGDVPNTKPDISGLFALTGFSPRTSVSEGIARFAGWCVSYHR